MPIWLSKTAVCSTHKLQIGLFGGIYGIRDESILDSALHRPQQIFHYDKTSTIPCLASWYAVALTQNHPFIDGNKRISLTACVMFLKMNGHNFSAPQQDAYEMILKLSSGNLEFSNFQAWIGQHTLPI